MRAPYRFILLVLVAALSACGNAAPRASDDDTSVRGTPAGRVIKVSDGDTVTILTPEHQKQRIRLAEIDTPERKQPWGAQAQRALSSRVAGRDISLSVHDIDRYGRVVAVVYVDGRDVNAELVQAGHAWVYRRYLKRPELLDLEADARRHKRGLWALPAPERIPPWQWRAAH